MSIFDENGLFAKPAGQQLWRTLAGLFPVPLDAIAFAEKFGVDPLDLPQGLTPRQLWHVLIEKTFASGELRNLVQAALDANKKSPHATFLKGVLDKTPVTVSPEPMEGFDPKITNEESLLFVDDLTMAVGRVPRLIETLQKLHALAPAVCLLRVTNACGEFSGTGFRIGPERVLTNHHVLFPAGAKGTTVQADFGFDVDLTGASVNGDSLPGDPGSIDGAPDDDWAVVKVANIPTSIPVINLAKSRTPAEGDRAFIVQHPDGQRKRLGFVRNMITAVSNDRVQYLTDTQPGSSGAPVFDDNATLIALHHRGGTPTQKTGKAPLTKNQGVRIDRVLAGLKARGVRI